MASLDPNAYARGVASVPQINLLAGQQQQTANLMNLIKVKQMGQEMQDKQALRNAMAGVNYDRITPQNVAQVGMYDAAQGADLRKLMGEQEEKRATQLAGILFAASRAPDDDTILNVHAPALEKLIGPEEARPRIAQFLAADPATRKNIALAEIVNSKTLLPLAVTTADAELRAITADEDRAQRAADRAADRADRQIYRDQALELQRQGIEMRRGLIDLQLAEANRRAEQGRGIYGTPSGLPTKQHGELLAKLPQIDAANARYNQTANETLRNLDAILNTPRDVLDSIFGPIDSRLPPELRSAAANDAQARIEALKGTAMIDAMAGVRQASPTGAAFGNTSNFESQNLLRSKAPFTEAGTTDEILRAAQNYKNDLEVSRSIMNDAYRATVGWRDEMQPAGNGATPAAPATPRAAVTPPPNAIEFLRANPDTRDQFDGMFGPGSSAQYLGR